MVEEGQESEVRSLHVLCSFRLQSVHAKALETDVQRPLR